MLTGRNPMAVKPKPAASARLAAAAHGDFQYDAILQ
jgi:hypothetical protein